MRDLIIADIAEIVFLVTLEAIAATALVGIAVLGAALLTGAA